MQNLSGSCCQTQLVLLGGIGALAFKQISTVRSYSNTPEFQTTRAWKVLQDEAPKPEATTVVYICVI